MSAGDAPDPGAWGLQGALQPLGQGARNTVFRCGAHVLKSTGHGEAALRWLARPQAAARAAGFLVPALLPTRSGRLAHRGWTAEPYLPGPLASAADLASLAPLIRAFHSRCRDLPQRPGAPSALSAGRLLHQMPQPLAARLERCLAPVAGMAAGAIHGDLNAGNVILTADGPALIDWDEARRDALCLDHLALGQPGTPAQRHAALAWEIACCWRPEPARARRLARGLIRSAGPAPIP